MIPSSQPGSKKWAWLSKNGRRGVSIDTVSVYLLPLIAQRDAEHDFHGPIERVGVTIGPYAALQGD